MTEATSNSFISIIIPMRNEEAFVGACLDSVLAQVEGRNDVEILCVDGASTDGTRDIVSEYARREVGEARIDVELVDAIERTNGGKVLFLVSKVDPNRVGVQETTG